MTQHFYRCRYIQENAPSSSGTWIPRNHSQQLEGGITQKFSRKRKGEKYSSFFIRGGKAASFHMDLTEEHSPLILISAKVCLGQHSVLGSFWSFAVGWRRDCKNLTLLLKRPLESNIFEWNELRFLSDTARPWVMYRSVALSPQLEHSEFSQPVSLARVRLMAAMGVMTPWKYWFIKKEMRSNTRMCH